MLIQLLEEQTAGAFSKRLGQFAMRNLAQLTSWSVTGTTQLMSMALLKIGEALQHNMFEHRGSGETQVGDNDETADDDLDSIDVLEATTPANFDNY